MPAMSGCVALTSIDLGYNKLTAEGLDPFCSNPPPNLTKLEMSSCGLQGTYCIFRIFVVPVLRLTHIQPSQTRSGCYRASRPSCYMGTGSQVLSIFSPSRTSCPTNTFLQSCPGQLEASLRWRHYTSTRTRSSRRCHRRLARCRSSRSCTHTAAA